jgi:hypothetical protein
VRAPASAKDAFRRLSLQPDAFDYDRAFRLLEAAVNDASVKRANPARADLYRREAELGKLPLVDSFAILRKLVPELTDLEPEAAPNGSPGMDSGNEADSSERELAVIRRLQAITGPKARNEDPLVRSHIAYAVAHFYLSTRHGSPFSLDLRLPLFEPTGNAAGRTWRTTVTFGRGDSNY